MNKLSGWLLAMSASVALCTGASAQAVSPAVDSKVNDCVYQAGVTGTFQVVPTRFGNVDAYSVPPESDVSGAQSQQINACIAQAVGGTPRKRVRVQAAIPTDTAGCLAEYKGKLRSTRNGLDYKGRNIGTRLVSGLFGKRLGRTLIENEYDRCLDQVAYASDRCPTGVFTGGAGYCIRRPYQ